jgi:hypothetical protein
MGKEGERTALLDTLHSSTRDSLVDSLCSILDGVYGALAGNGSGAEEAGLADDLLTEHICFVLFARFGESGLDFEELEG